MVTQEEPSQPSDNDKYYRLRSYAWVIIVVVTPFVSIVGSGLTAYYTSQRASLQTNVEMTKLALSVLRDPGSSDQLKKWASKLLVLHSQVDLAALATTRLENALVRSSNVTYANLKAMGLLEKPHSPLRRAMEALTLIPDLNIKGSGMDKTIGAQF